MRQEVSVGWWALGCVLVAAQLGACGSPAAELDLPTKPAERSARGAIVATVDGDPITLAEVEQLVGASDLSPRQALLRLERERLLAAYAERRGYGRDASAARELQKARVRALLHATVEPGTAPEDVTPAEVDQRFQAIRARDERPEVRSVVHVLFKLEAGVSEPKARAAAEAWLRELRALSSVDDAAAALEAVPAKGKRDGLPVVREGLDARQDGKLEAPFTEAVFSLSEPGLVPRLARTSFGYHIMLLRNIRPPVVLEPAAYEPGIRKQLSIERRTAALTALVAELTAREPPVLDEALVRSALADERLLGALP